MHSLKVKYRARNKVGDVVETPICVDEDVPGVPAWVFQLGEQKAAILRASSYHPLCVSFDLFASKQVTQPFQSPPPQDKILFPSGSGTRSESLLHPAGLSLNICKPLTWLFPNARGGGGVRCCLLRAIAQVVVLDP